MPEDKTKNPMEGKGEEMIPDRGLPFDDIEDTPLEDIPPEERLPEVPEVEELPDEEMAAVETMMTREELPPDAVAENSETHFELAEKEVEAIVGEIENAFEMEASPWSPPEELAEHFVSDGEEAFSRPKCPSGQGNPWKASKTLPLQNQLPRERAKLPLRSIRMEA